MSYPPEFKSDGCSDCRLSTLFWVLRQELPEQMHEACVEHDYAYWVGGTYAERLAADKALRTRLVDLGFHWIGQLYYLGVRAFGGRYWRVALAKRWGYGELLQLSK